MKKTALLLSLVFLATAATAHLSLEEHRLGEMKELYNEETDHVPSAASSIVGDQVLVAHVDYGNTTKNATAEFSGVKMESLERGVTSEPTVEVWATRETINEIGEAEDPLKKLKKELDRGELEYQVHGFLNQVRFSLLEAFL